MEESDEVRDSLDSISYGAGLFIGGRIFSRGIGLITNVILTRTLGTNLYGIYAYFNVITSLVHVFTNLGNDNAVLRYIPEYEDEPIKQRMTLTLAYGTSLGASLLGALALYSAAPLISSITLADPLFVKVLRIGALILPFHTLSNVTLSAFKAMERMDYNVAVASVANPLFRLLFVGGAVILGYAVIGAIAGLIVAGVLTFAVGLTILIRQTDLVGLASPSGTEAINYYDFSIPLTLTQLGSFLYNRVDILMVGFLLTGSAVGVYHIAVTLAGLLILPLTAFSQLFAPIASRLYQNNDLAELEWVYATVTRWTFTISIFPTLALVLYAEEVLLVFGEGFTLGVVVVGLLALAQFTNSAVGPSGWLLMMSENQYLTLFNQVGSGILNAVLNYFFILEFGFVGAAIATATVLAAINILRVVEVWHIHRIHPYNRRYLKPLFAGVMATVALWLASVYLTHYTLLLGGGAIGAVCFLLVLYLLGIEDEDIELLKQAIL